MKRKKNTKYFKKSKKEQIEYLDAIKQILLQFVQQEKEPFLSHVYEELYLKDKNLNSLFTFADTKEKALHERNKILLLARTISGLQKK